MVKRYFSLLLYGSIQLLIDCNTLRGAFKGAGQQYKMLFMNDAAQLDPDLTILHSHEKYEFVPYIKNFASIFCQKRLSLMIIKLLETYLSTPTLRTIGMIGT